MTGKFVQIAVANDDLTGHVFVYALDDQGRVWAYRRDDGTWFRLGEERR